MSESKMKKIINQPGVYYRESITRRHRGKVDRCFYITFRKNGRKIWEKAGWTSEGYSTQMAANIRAERMRSIRHGQDLPKEKAKVPTLKLIAKEYLKWSAENKNRAGIEDKSRYENHLKDRFDNKYLDEITVLDLEQMKTDMAKDDYSPKTIAHSIGLLRSMYNKAAEWNLYHGSNPGAQVKKPVIQNARDRWLTFEESETLLKELKRNPQIKPEYKELKDPKLHDMALLSLHTGARAGEIFKIKGSDVNFDTRLITLRDTKNTETRHCPMTVAVTEMLRRRMPKNLNSYVFTDIEGEKIKEISNAFERIVDRLKMNDGVNDRRRRVLFHSLRHTFASWLAIEGTPLYTIAKLMGHKSIAMSERYSHLSPDYKKDIVIGLERMFDRKKVALPTEEPKEEKPKSSRKKKTAPPVQPSVVLQ
jgi:integrase